MALPSDEQFLADLRAGMSLNKIAAKYDVARSTAQKRKKRLAGHAPAATLGETGTEESSDGTKAVTAVRHRPVTLEDARDWIRSTGDNPDDYTLSIRSIAYGEGLFSNRMSAVPKRKKAEATEVVDLPELLERVKGFTYIPAPKATGDQSLVVVPTDLQVGKVDWNGRTEDTIAQALTSFHRAAEIAKETRPAEIVMVDAGDPIENIYSTSSQLGTNDRDLPHQVEAAAHILLSGIEILAPLAPKLRYTAVSSNHGAHRLGPKSPAGDVHADYGIVIAKMIGRALTLNRAAFGHVTVQTPDPYHESLVFDTSGSRIGVVHGHQAGSPDKIGEWWKGQSHGRMPTGDARILIAGHFHSLRVQQSGDARWIMVGPASDRGSSWFTNSRGESSQSGMMSFLTRDNEWDSLKIL